MAEGRHDASAPRQATPACGRTTTAGAAGCGSATVGLASLSSSWPTCTARATATSSFRYPPPPVSAAPYFVGSQPQARADAAARRCLGLDWSTSTQRTRRARRCSRCGAPSSCSRREGSFLETTGTGPLSGRTCSPSRVGCAPRSLPRLSAPHSASSPSPADVASQSLMAAAAAAAARLNGSCRSPQRAISPPPALPPRRRGRWSGLRRRWPQGRATCQSWRCGRRRQTGLSP
mmetsp:Transcript_2674/g.8314  ORF Transcript_2674/g.8314 Transcript_2674/m.8314 type:complete len:233 (-) Transcript_2674:180-878(-)